MSSSDRAQRLDRSDRNLAWSVFCLLLACYLATFAGLPENPDAEAEFQTTSALVRTQSFALGGTPEAEAIKAQGFNVRAGKPGREQQYFSWSGIGQPLVALPFYVAGSLLARLLPEVETEHRTSTFLGIQRSEYFEHLLVGLRNPLLGALTGALIVLAARRAGARRLHAGLAGISYGLCSYAWPQARGTLSDVQATAFLFLAFVAALDVAARLERGEPGRLGAVLGFGAALGTAFLTRPVLAPAVAVLALHYGITCMHSARQVQPSRRPWRELVLGLAPAAALFGLFLYTNWSRFGSVLESGYGGVVTSDWFLRPSGVGLVGGTVSPGSGLLWFAPGLLLVVPWLWHELARGERRLPLLVLAILATIGIPHVLIPSWNGAWSYGPRYMLPMVPFLWFPLGVACELLWERWLGRVLVLALLGLGGVVALGGVLVEYTTNIDLSFQAARLEWPTIPDLTNEDDAENERFVRTKFDWRFAAPWAHWRIFRHRMAGLGEEFPVRELYFLARDEVLTPSWERSRGFSHFAWVDLTQRLGGPKWLGPVLCTALLAASFALLSRSRAADTA